MDRDPSTRDIVQQLLAEEAPSFLVNRRFLHSRLLVYALARFSVAGAMAFGAWFAGYVVGIDGLPRTSLYVLAGLLFLYSCLVFLFLYLRTWGSGASHHQLTAVMHGTIGIDFIFLTAALWHIGGAASPFASLYILHIILAAMLLSRIGVLLQSSFAYLLYAGLVLMQVLDWFPPHMPAGAVLADMPMDARYAATLLTVQAILFMVTGFLVSEIAAALKRGEAALRELNVELKQLSEMRRDFLHVVTHNLKAPAAAATMLLETVENLWAVDASESARAAIHRARMRTQELGDLVQDLQHLAALESGALKKEEQSVDLNDVVRKLLTEYESEALRRKQSLRAVMEETLPGVRAVPRLLYEAAVNYVTNAIKYTPEGGTIVLKTRRDSGAAVFEVEDTGIGIAAEHVDRLFGEFVRVPAEGSGARPPGIGLGLSIVKRIVEHYRGKVYVRSTPGKGSVFGFSLPGDDNRIL